MNDPKPQIIIDFIADPLCPWCYIGKRSLDRVRMALSFNYEVVVRYRPFQLNPNTPEEGVSRPEYIEKKFPDLEARQQMIDALKEAAKGVGVNFDPETPLLSPNSLNALRMIRWAHLEADASEVIEAIFHAYWKEGANIGSPQVLSEIASKVEMDPKSVKARLETDEEVKDIIEEAKAIKAGGVTNVPTFIVNESLGFAGALPPDQLLTTIQGLIDETLEA